ncbi:aminotransferase class III-fold pyridoxal phosphate-dependent enzyme, partial [bacterium]|nr:aminotransferase class III-fold pyridoxal phosphate-dependent enzyme [bacterium]
MVGGAFYHNGERIEYLPGWKPFRQPLQCGESETLTFNVAYQFSKPGTYQLKLDIVRINHGFFEEWNGSQPLLHPFTINAQDEIDVMWNRGLHHCTNLWTPTDGARYGEHHSYPLFIEKTSGCRFTDAEGRSFLDYVMGWGTSILGYNHPIVQEAIQKHLSIAPTLPLPHQMQIETAEQLCEMLPCSERVLFSKNGSDAVEIGVRIARAYTNRTLILCCGYHGFHDWYAGAIHGVEGVTNETR